MFEYIQMKLLSPGRFLLSSYNCVCVQVTLSYWKRKWKGWIFSFPDWRRTPRFRLRYQRKSRNLRFSYRLHFLLFHCVHFTGIMYFVFSLLFFWVKFYNCECVDLNYPKYLAKYYTLIFDCNETNHWHYNIKISRNYRWSYLNSSSCKLLLNVVKECHYLY